MKELTLTQAEQTRLQVMNGVLAHQIGVHEAAEVLGLSERQVWRILAAYRKEGAAAIAHGNRDRQPVNMLPSEMKQHIVTVVRERYAGINYTHLSELLAEREGIIISRSSLRRILRAAGLASSRQRRMPRHRCRRERMPQEGMLLQMDGSRHDWLEGRGPWLSLLLAVDDATGTVPHALFREQEDSEGYLLLLREVIEQKGMPLAIYSDRHSAFKSPCGEQPTQLARALRELGIHLIFARSPQARGRVERMAGTFQNRMVTQLRLAGADSLVKANQVLWDFLPSFNHRFGVAPAQPDGVYRSADVDLAGILCFKHQRKVARDNTVKYNWRTLQLLPARDRPSYAGSQVEVQHRLDGSLVVCHQEQVIPTQEAPHRLTVLRSLKGSGDGSPLISLARGVSPNGAQGWGWLGLGSPSEKAAAGSPEDVQAKKDIRHRVPPPRRPTPRQQARWEAIQEAKRHGLSLRAIARRLGVDRDTVRKYAKLDSPPICPARGPRRTRFTQEGELTESLSS